MYILESWLAKQQTGPVDYYPWSNNHAEDTLSDQTIKSGFQNKPLVTNETNNSALKPSFKPFKGNGAPALLSSLFVAVLDKRQTSGRITGPSTAKAPPRVSLTSSRREAWLQDLSNPSVPLKKLNRTIPFGITGKVLLEQCLSKSIPIGRAIWVSKAVGINELRAYKRKGSTGPGAISGELKWIREWTANIQQFIESTCDLCGQPDFNAKMQYAISLSTHLFAENLLDQEMFVDWLLTSAEKIRIERLPVWLLLIQVYWKHLVSTRRRGRRLAQCLLSRLDAASSDAYTDLLTPIIKRMQVLLATLAVKSKGCMVLPSAWPQYQRLLSTMVDKTVHPALRSAMEELNVRNKQLTPGASPTKNEHTRQNMIIELLDNANSGTNFDELFELCCKIGNDLSMVASTILQWGSSIYRSGSHHVYLAARMLRRFYELEIDVDPMVISLLSSQRSHTVDFEKILAITAQLVRSGHFSIRRYCQSLIVYGVVGETLESSQPERRLNLLQELPIDGCHELVCILRKNLLSDAGLPSSPSPSELDAIQATVDLPSDSSTTPLLLPELHHLSSPAKDILCSWVTERLNTFNQISTDDHQYAKESYCSITRNDFCTFREMIEQLEDMELLGRLLRTSLISDDAEILTPIIETLEFHLECFAAIGTLHPLLDRLVERYQTLRMKIHLDKSLVSAMNVLFATLNTDSRMQVQLKNDLAQCHQRAVLAMCSPASDNAVDVLMSDEVDTDDEIDRILSSGTTMDEQIVARVFKRITSRAGECKDDRTYTVRCGQWFTKLRAFDQSTFDNLMQEWITQTMASDRHTCLLMVPVLVGCGCSTIASLVQCTNYCRISAKSDRQFCATLDLDILELLLVQSTSTDVVDPEVRYRYELERRKFIDLSATTILNCFQRAIQSYGVCKSEGVRGQFRNLLQRKSVVDFLKRAAVHSHQQIQDCFCGLSNVNDGSVADLNKETILALFGDDRALIEGESSTEVLQLFEMADELSLPMCQLALVRLIPHDPKAKSPASAKVLDTVQKELLTLSQSTTVWQEMLSVLDDARLHALCNAVEGNFLTAMKIVIDVSSNISSPDASEVLFRASALARQSLGFLEALSVGKWYPRFPAIYELLRVFVEGLLSYERQQSRNPWYARSFAECIYCLLRLFVLLKHASSKGQVHIVENISVISQLCTLLALPSLQPFSDLLQFTFDVLLYFSDDLSDEQRGQLSQRHSSDPRLAFAFGISNPQSTQSPQDSWLGLVTSASNPTPSTAAPPSSTGTSSPAPRFPHQRTASGTPRPATPSPQQQPPTRAPTPLGMGRGAAAQAQQQKQWNPPALFPLRRWEVLPDAGTVGAVAGAGVGGNDTSISLALFGARRVG